ncbi:cytochrome P450 [Aspergillus thermomutatus]|uniref:Phenylacetate 2-hydroxylase n=1 Tax=Aspergillus thermomutatus TaxID=41047 RepID=A0A397G4B3_ASPTH|nr:uncharacterized protein CDV56_102744 [Aspergillus thermomutatus]RHZ44176.1 hypothetical protein CDV56_102744 [Aspergillus thermomutatus]
MSTSPLDRQDPTPARARLPPTQTAVEEAKLDRRRHEYAILTDALRRGIPAVRIPFLLAAARPRSVAVDPYTEVHGYGYGVYPHLRGSYRATVPLPQPQPQPQPQSMLAGRHAQRQSAHAADLGHRVAYGLGRRRVLLDDSFLRRAYKRRSWSSGVRPGSGDIMALQTVVIAVLAAVYFLMRYLNRTDIPKIKGLPEIPGVPLFGNLLQLGDQHATVAAKWAKKYGPVFQVRMGNKRIVFANSFDSVKQLWIKDQSALISRPTFHTFHSVVSSSQGFTIGTSPWDESCKRRRKAAATALNRPAVQSYMPIIDLEATASIRELLKDCRNGAVDINPTAYFQRFALNTSLTLNYGFRIEGNVDDALLREIVDVERGVSNFRSTSNNWQDYIPLLRMFPKTNREAEEFRVRRDKYLTYLLDMLKERIAKGTDKPCITGNILKDPEAKLNEAEVKSICLTMVSAGLDTVPGNLIMGIAYLASEDGQRIQQKAYEEIMKVYPTGDAWEKCLVEEKVAYVTALVKETLRYWTVIPICLPRESTKDIVYNGATIPAGTTFFMNAWAADYDEEHFKMPDRFIPERYLDVSEGSGTPHYGYGAGSRMCAGSHLANRELYTAYIRLITAFTMHPARDPADRPILDAIECNAIPTALTTEPKPFKVGFKPRDASKLQQWMAESDERTKEL